MTNETKYVVISEKKLRILMAQLDMSQHERNEAVLSNTIPAQELWDAAQDAEQYNMFNTNTITCTDFLTTKFPNND